MVYILLPNKEQQTYTSMMNILLASMDNETNVEVVTVDFEKAALNAFSEVLGDKVILSGCYFHFTQNLMKHVRKNSAMV